MRRKLVGFWVLILLFGLSASAGPLLKSSFDLEVPLAPRTVVVNGAERLAYELHLTNFAQTDLELKCISVLDGSSQSEITKVCDEALAGRLGAIPQSSDRQTIQPGMRAVVYLDIDLAGEANPKTIYHRILYIDEKKAEHIAEGAKTTLKAMNLQIDPPVRGGPWVAVYNPIWERGHRRVFYAIDGKARLPGRFAIDWMKVDQEGRLAKGDEDQIVNWYGYGAEVLAVADAVVAGTRDTIQESQTISAHQRPTLDEAAGNFIVLDLGNGSFAFYEHLKPGSILVKAGDRVRSGQVIAALGFTGSSTGPHLHFHVADRNSTLGAEGIPYVLRNFKLAGSYSSLDEFGKKPWTPAANTEKAHRSSEFPSPGAVILFD